MSIGHIGFIILAVAVISFYAVLRKGTDKASKDKVLIAGMSLAFGAITAMIMVIMLISVTTKF